VHLYVAKGAVTLEGAGALGTGDAARISGSDGARVTAGADGAELLVWEMHAGLR
jgi:redox-sensitive bicupin YhaK (pirin superfamily)